MTETYYQQVVLRYQLYNSLFLLLPFEDINKTGTLLPLFTKVCEEGFQNGKKPDEVIQRFFDDYMPEDNHHVQLKQLFQFIQYIERQIVLFDSIEDASFEQIKNLTGRGSLNELSTKIRANDKKAELQSLIQKVSIRVVLTAHPTQFYPGEVLGIITDLDHAIKKGEISDVDILLRQLGKTPFIKKLKPSPYDEAVSLIWYLENIFYKAMPELVKEILSLAEMSLDEWENEDLISIGFWPGGDRDGNPFVSPEITIQVADKLKNTILKCYYRDLRIIKRRLTFKGVSPLVSEIEQKIYNGAYGNGKNSYKNADELHQDLVNISTILKEVHNGLFLNLIEEFILKVRIFGFCLAKLDIRQQNKKHHQALEQMSFNDKSLKGKTYLSLKEDERIAYLLKTKSFQYAEEDAEAKDFMETIRSLKEIQTKNGEIACNRYIISNATSVSDILEVFAMGRFVFEHAEHIPIDVIPLFESVDDLDNAAHVMEKLYQIKEYRAHLKHRKGKQVIMLGFSDGTKDGGYLKANWGIFKAKEALTNISKQYGIDVVFFDGRGGPPGRGGGNTYEFYASQGETIASTEFQLTIQGQTISSNYGKTASCKYNLEQLFCALIDNQLFRKESLKLSTNDRDLIEKLSDAAYQKYLKLKKHKAFVPYLENATPLRWFGDTNIGSRPAKRNQKDKLVFEDLRAIPFVGSWAQMKQNIPGYFGIGTAIEEIADKKMKKDLMNLCEKSAFVQTLFSNSTQSLAKCNFSLSSWLTENKDFADFYQVLVDEFERSKKNILEVMQQEELMEDFPASKASVMLREKIVLPLVAIQQFALQMLNTQETKESERHTYEKLTLRCMFGIINAARNSA